METDHEWSAGRALGGEGLRLLKITDLVETEENNKEALARGNSPHRYSPGYVPNPALGLFTTNKSAHYVLGHRNTLRGGRRASSFRKLLDRYNQKLNGSLSSHVFLSGKS
jgi:hypothetical protein